MSDALRALSFSKYPSDRPWIPEGASDYASWSLEPDVSGTFTVGDHTFLYLQLRHSESQCRYWIGLLPEGTAHQDTGQSDSMLRSWSMGYLGVRERRDILIDHGLVEEDIYRVPPVDEKDSDPVPVETEVAEDSSKAVYAPAIYAGYFLRDLFPPL